MEFLIAAISLGFLGSFHCIGMCGPIALALPLHDKSFSSRLAGSSVYNAGRIIVYSAFGILFGLLGKSFIISGYQQLFSIILGVILILIIVLPKKIKNRFSTISFVYKFISKQKERFGKLFSKKNSGSLFIIGIFNGFLPCGLVYLGVAGAIATGDPFKGALFMAAFGAGTLPLMISLPLIGNSLNVTFRTKIRKAIPVFVVMMGLVLILRGMNLGIPYLSPSFSAHDATQMSCCHK